MNRWIPLFLFLAACDDCSTAPPTVSIDPSTGDTPINDDETTADEIIDETIMPPVEEEPEEQEEPEAIDEPEETVDDGPVTIVVTPQHQDANAYQHWNNATPVTEISQAFTIEEAADDSFFALNLDFVDTGRGAYIGWQPTGLFSDGGSGEMAIFSVWDAVEAEGSCTPFGGEGVGMSCRAPYPLDYGADATVTVRQDPRADGLWWVGEITSDGVTTEIGAIKSAFDTDIIVDSSNFVEYYGPQTTCTDVPPMVVLVDMPTSPDGVHTEGSTSIGACSGGLVEPDGDAYLIALGQ